MSVPLPQLQPKSYTPKPAFAEPPAKTPVTFKTPKGTKPGQQTSPYRIKPPEPPPAATAAGTGATASGIGIGSALAAVGGAIAIVLIFDEPLNKDQGNVPQPSEPPVEIQKAEFPFKGGQGTAIPYGVTLEIKYRGDPTLSRIDTSNPYIELWGAIGGTFYTIANTDSSGNVFSNIFLNAHGEFGRPEGPSSTLITTFVTKLPGVLSAKIKEIRRLDNQPDTFGDPPPTNPSSSSAPGNSPGAPSAAPPSAAPSAAPGASGGKSPGGSPSPSPSPAPLPNPGPVPQPQPQLQKQPEPQPNPFPFAEPAPKPGLNLGAPPGTSPSPTPAPAPSNFNSGNKAPAPAPGTSPSIKKDPLPINAPTPYPDTGFQPDQFSPNPLVENPLEPKKFAPNPNTGNPEPKAPPKSDPPKTPAPAPAPNDDLFKQIQNLIGPITIALAGITALVNPNAIRSAANAGTCDAFAPGGCAAPVADNAAAAANNSANNSRALSALSAAISALQTAFLQPILAGVNLINTKLGPVMAGANGIAGFLGRLSSSLGIDRALNLIAIASNLHNAMMLSANLKITLLEMLSSVGNATGLLQTSEGENVDLNQVFNAGIERFLISILGVESYAGLKVGLRKYNAIYQAATNSLNAVSSMFNSLGNVVEQGAEYTGRIGNALKGAGMVAENSYRWMSEKFDAKSSKFIKFQSTIGDVTQVLETINEIAETVVEGQQAATEFQKANTDFIKAVEDAKKGTPPENKEVQAEAAKAKENATKDPTGELEEGLLSFLTN